MVSLIKCDSCNGRQWVHILPENDATRYWIERCDECSEHLWDEHAAVLAAAQIGGYPAEAVCPSYTLAMLQQGTCESIGLDPLNMPDGEFERGAWVLLLPADDQRWHSCLVGVPDEWIATWEPQNTHERAPAGAGAE